MKKKLNISRILFAIVLIILVPLLLINVTIMIKAIVNPDKVPSIFGVKPLIVMTDSMKPTIKGKDLIFSKEVDTGTLAIGDIISFKDSDKTITTHRIVDIVIENDEMHFYTRGDNNNTDDTDYILSSQIEGKYIGRIALLGGFIEYIQTKEGMLILGLILVIIILSIISISAVAKNRKLEQPN